MVWSFAFTDMGYEPDTLMLFRKNVLSRVFSMLKAVSLNL